MLRAAKARQATERGKKTILLRTDPCRWCTCEAGRRVESKKDVRFARAMIERPSEALRREEATHHFFSTIFSLSVGQVFVRRGPCQTWPEDASWKEILDSRLRSRLRRDQLLQVADSVVRAAESKRMRISISPTRTDVSRAAGASPGDSLALDADWTVADGSAAFVYTVRLQRTLVPETVVRDDLDECPVEARRAREAAQASTVSERVGGNA